MRTLCVLLLGVALACALPFGTIGCGGGGGGGDDDADGGLMGSVVFLNQAVLWIDTDDSSAIDAGDVLVFSFDRPVAQGANAPVDDLVVTGGTLVAASWGDGFEGDATKLRLHVSAGDVITAGKLGGGTTFNVSPTNTITNPADDTVGATPAASAATTAGRLRDTGQDLGGGSSFAIQMFDIDGDGDKDGVVGTNGLNFLFVNNGVNTGVFAPGGAIAGEMAAVTRGIGVGHADMDALPDFVAANAGPSNANRVYLQTGPGTFATTNTAGRDLLGASNSAGVVMTSNAFASWDGQPGGEIFVANNGLNQVFYADATGQFNGDGGLAGIPLPQFVGGATDTRGVAIGDLDADGDQDVVTVDDGGASPGTVTAWLVTPGVGAAATFTPVALMNALVAPRAVVLCDADADTDLDVIVGYANGGGMQVFLQDGVNTGTFALFTTILGGDVRAIACADMDGDGFDDVVQGRADGVAVFVNCGGGNFLNAQILVPGSIQALAVCGTQSLAPPDPLSGFDSKGTGDVVTAGAGGANRVLVGAK